MPNADHVCASMRPVEGSPCAFWNVATALRMFSPNAPSISPGEYQARSSRIWARTTPAPRAPRASAGVAPGSLIAATKPVASALTRFECGAGGGGAAWSTMGVASTNGATARRNRRQCWRNIVPPGHDFASRLRRIPPGQSMARKGDWVARLAPTRLVGVRIVVRNPAARRDAIVQFRRKARVFARSEGPAFTLEAGIAAEDPVAPLDTQR